MSIMNIKKPGFCCDCLQPNCIYCGEGREQNILNFDNIDPRVKENLEKIQYLNKRMITYRNLTIDDLDVCIELLKTKENTCFDGSYPDKKYLQNFIIDKMCFVATNSSDEIIGCLFSEKLKGDGALLNFLAVRPDYKRKGIGTNLLNMLQALLLTKNIKWLVLYSTTSSEQNKEFYKKNNFLNNGSFFEIGKFIVLESDEKRCN